ncbi:sigma-70 family RNA polymerase sigma factor [Salisaeta longa]|uniref:sigma-70 family RNA polymerase sigma factor n=1 Tax=Salisaeta longa TaxID=503170 RepID=UPI0003B6720F|nr:sigma-70 family RNA polymerase sigma factor [Salisaeta longa]
MPNDVTQLLSNLQGGADTAADALWDEVYDELRRIAHFKLLRERQGHTLSTTALVHEAYLKLIDQTQVEWQDRLHFFAMSSRIMRNILIDYARKRKAQKRGGDAAHLQLEDAVVAADESADVFLALDKALSQLATVDERLARVVEYRFFGGMQEKEIAELLDLSPRTIRRDWRKAKAWLSRALKESPEPVPSA